MTEANLGNLQMIKHINHKTISQWWKDKRLENTLGGMEIKQHSKPYEDNKNAGANA